MDNGEGPRPRIRPTPYGRRVTGMTLIDLTPVSATSPQLAVVCTEFECVVSELVSRHVPSGGDPGEQAHHIARGFDTDYAAEAINGSVELREVRMSALLRQVQTEYALSFERARDTLNVLVDRGRAERTSLTTITLGR